MDIECTPTVRPMLEDFRWDGVELKPYKQDDSALFKDISRQVLFQNGNLGCELRYFEMDAGGYSTLERHEHAHAVMVLRGHGECLVGENVRRVARYDLVSIPAWSWHQFRASAEEPLGFLCMVNVQRDRPQVPSAEELTGLRANPVIARFLQTG